MKIEKNKGLTQEADSVLEKISDKEDENQISLCKVKMLYKNGEKEAAEKLLSEILEKRGNDWFCSGSAADICADERRYDDAIALYERLFTLQLGPKYIDSFEAISHIL